MRNPFRLAFAKPIIKRLSAARFCLNHSDWLSSVRYVSDGVISRHDMSAVFPVLNPDDLAFRHYVGEWCAHYADRRAPEGAIFVAVGTATGMHVRRILEKVKPNRPYWLLDAWDGRRSGDDASVKYPESTDFDSVRQSFAAWPNVRFLRGVVPGSLSGLPAEPIAFAYFCLGDTDAEIATFELLLPRLVRGGAVILNSFGRKRTSNAQRQQFIDVAARHANQLLILPTAHAILFA